MKRFLAATSVLVVAGALASAAEAKEVSAVKICGVSGCHAVAKEALRGFCDCPGTSAQSEVPAVAPQKYFVLRASLRGNEGLASGFKAALVAGPGLVRYEAGNQTFGWERPADAQLDALRKAAGGLEPFPAPRLVGVEIGSRLSSEPDAYEALLALAQPPTRSPDGPSTYITLRWAAENPWAVDQLLIYYPRTRTLLGTHGYVQVPPGLATRLEREAAGLPLLPSSSFPWVSMAGTVGGGLALALLAAALLRHRRRTMVAAPT